MVASETLNKYGGREMVANSRASSVAFGASGCSADTPSISCNSPAFVKYNLSILPRKWEKDTVTVSSDANILAAEFPEPLNDLPKNSNGDLLLSATM